MPSLRIFFEVFLLRVKETWNYQRSIFFKIASNRTLQKIQIFLRATFSVKFRKLFKTKKRLVLSSCIELGSRNDISDDKCISTTTIAATTKDAAQITQQHQQLFDVVCTVHHLTICIWTNKMHRILVIRLFISIRCSTCFGLYQSIFRSNFISCTSHLVYAGTIRLWLWPHNS